MKANWYDAEIPLSGRLKDNDLITVLRHLNRNKKTGALNLRRNDQDRSIYLKGGEIIFAMSRYIDDRLGEMLLRLDRITLDQYERSVEELKKGDKRHGTILVELGYMSPGDLVWSVKYHAKEIIVSTFSWIDGQYEFTEGNPRTDEVITIHMGMANLILEGIKRINDWTRLWNELPPVDTALQITGNPINLFQDIDLEDREREIIAKINGERSIRDIFRESGLKAFETLKMVYFLFRLRMVEAVKAEGTKIEEEVYTEADVSGKTEDKGRYPASKASVEGEAPSGFAGGGGDASPCNRELRRQKIIDAHNAMALMDHYQILGLKKGASGDEVKKAYFRLAKEYHPDIHYQEGMDEMKGMLEAIFGKITESYDVLSTDQTKKEYDLYSVISKHERRKPREEKTDVRALAQYQRGLDAFKKGDLKEAINSIQWAIKLEPTRPAYYTLLGKILTLIPGRIKDAEDAFMRAIELEPSNPENHIGLGSIYKKGGMKQRAIRSFEEALIWDPENTEAKREVEGLK